MFSIPNVIPQLDHGMTQDMLKLKTLFYEISQNIFTIFLTSFL